MKNHNIGKILVRSTYNMGTRIARNSYRVVETVGGWEIYRCPNTRINAEWIDCEGNKITAWQFDRFVPVEEKDKFLNAYRDHLLENGQEWKGI